MSVEGRGSVGKPKGSWDMAGDGAALNSELADSRSDERDMSEF